MLLNFVLYQIIIIFMDLINNNEARDCDIVYCNFEGVCKNNKCHCIGTQYFSGPTCSNLVNLCANNTCQNDGECKQFVGQYICDNCAKGYGGDKCHLKMPNVLKNVLLHFDHRAIYGEKHKFLIMVEDLGDVAFDLEFVEDNYAISFFKTDPTDKQSVKFKSDWKKVNDFYPIFEGLDLKYWKKLPFNSGYYHIATQTFWTEGLHNLNLSIFDSATSTKQLYYNAFKLLVVQSSLDGYKCIPKGMFTNGNSPIMPEDTDVALYTNYEVIITKRCHRNSQMTFRWKFYDSVGDQLLHDFGETKRPHLKIRAYSLRYKHYGTIHLTYRLEVEITETYGHSIGFTKLRCFVYLMPKVTLALIRGGKNRKVGYGQKFILDGTVSRDYAYAPDVDQNLHYEWSCFSKEDPEHKYCNRFFSREKKVRMSNNGYKMFNLDTQYTFNLTVYSKMFMQGRYNTTMQNITFVKDPQLAVEVQCVRGCKRVHTTPGFIVHLKATLIDYQFSLGLKSKHVKVNWTNDRGDQHSDAYRVIYPAPGHKIFTHRMAVKVEYNGQVGFADYNLTFNYPPKRGNCNVTPTEGIACHTRFNVTCAHWWDPKFPIIFYFKTDDNYTIDQNDNGNMTNVYLPETNNMFISICDELFSCKVHEIPVTVSALPNASTYLEKHKNVLRHLLMDGDIRGGMMLIRTLVHNMENGSGADLLIQEFEDFNFERILNIHQLTQIGKEFCTNLLPFDYNKAYIFGKFMAVLRRVWEYTLLDGEVVDMHYWDYNLTSEQLTYIANEVSYVWGDDIPFEVDLDIDVQVVTRDNATAENYLALPFPNITIIERINKWSFLTLELNKCLDLLGRTASIMHSPTEAPLIYEFEPTKQKSYAIDLVVVEEDLLYVESSYSVKFPKQSIYEIRESLRIHEMVVQSIEIKEDHNPFWWYLDNKGILTSFVYFSIYPVNLLLSKKPVVLKTPFELAMSFQNQSEIDESKILSSYLISHMHMPIFKAKMPPQSILIVKFLNASIDLLVLMKCGKPPRSYETEKSHLIVPADEAENDEGRKEYDDDDDIDNEDNEDNQDNEDNEDDNNNNNETEHSEPDTPRRKKKIMKRQAADNEEVDNEVAPDKESDSDSDSDSEIESGNDTLPYIKKFMVKNYLNKEKTAYLAVLSKDRTSAVDNKKTNFSFIMEIQQCLTWSTSSRHPKWTSEGCQTMLHADTDNKIVCHCTHLSTHSGRVKAVIPSEDLRDVHMLLKKVPTNYSVLLLYFGIILLCLLLLLFICCTRSKYQCPVLITNLKHDEYDVEVFIVTGGPPNGSSTANIIFQFISAKGPYKVIAYQPKCLLKQNSICKFYMCSKFVDYPFKLKIYHDRQGRLPNWYCKEIIINDWKNQKHYVCHVEKWISRKPTIYNSIEDNPDKQRWCTSYRNTLSLIYKNWYQFQPCLGSKIFLDLPREYRTYVWIPQLLVTIFIVSYYYGPTTLKTYEEERDLYSYMLFYVWDIIWLGCLCYVINVFIYLIFFFCIYLLTKF